MKRIVLKIGVFFLCVLIGLQASTVWVFKQYPAKNLLGDPALRVFGAPLFVPWKFLSWEATVPDIREYTQQGFTFIVACSVLGIFFTILIGRGQGRGKKNEEIFGDARWANREEIKKLGLNKDEGVFLGQLSNGTYLRHEGPEHYAVIAPTRSGKGAGIVIPTLLTWKESALIYDLKEENYRKTANRRAEFSDIFYFNPKSINSAHFNPLLEVRPGLNEVRDAQNIANMIVEPENQGSSDHWVRTGNSLLVAAILHVLYTAPLGEKNLAGVTSFLSRPTHTLTDTLHEMLETKHIVDENGVGLQPHPHIQEAARDVLNKSPDDRSSVHSTVMGFLSLYRDPLLAHVTRDSDFRVTDLVSASRPKSLYLVIPPADILRLRPIIRLMVNQICRRLTEELPGEKEFQRRNRLLLMLDEFPALGRLEFFESALGFIAGYGLKAMLICQSMNQLRQTYGERNALLDNTHVKVFYTPGTIETAEYISRSLGQSTVEFRTQGMSGQKGIPYFTGKSESIHFTGRPLMTPREVLDMGSKDAVVFVGGSRPIKCEKIRYFEDGSFIPLVQEAQPRERTEEIQNETARLLRESVWAQKHSEIERVEQIDDENMTSNDTNELEIVGNPEEQNDADGNDYSELV